MLINDTRIRNTKPTSKPQKLYDGGGLFLLLQPNGSRWWRLKYRFDGKEKTLSLGVYCQPASNIDQRAASLEKVQAGIRQLHE